MSTPFSGPTSLTGGEKWALNLGSYNYLGFADPDSTCIPPVIEALHQFGCSTGSVRTAIGSVHSSRFSCLSFVALLYV
jgi:7-keto-8-aminopelargonate synthetase-like enzyme